MGKWLKIVFLAKTKADVQNEVLLEVKVNSLFVKTGNNIEMREERRAFKKNG